MTAHLTRMISHAAKWRENDTPGQVAADAIVRDLYTSENSLSFWLCDLEKQQDLDNVAIALASNRDTIARLDVVFLTEEELRRVGLEVRNVPGDTPAHSINPHHRNVGKLDLDRLSGLGGLIHSACLDPSAYRRYARGEIKRLLVEALENGVLKAADLTETLAEKIAEAAPPSDAPPQANGGSSNAG